MRSFLVIGLGRFGKHMVKKLSEQNNEVLAVDIREERVNACMQDRKSTRLNSSHRT